MLVYDLACTSAIRYVPAPAFPKHRRVHANTIILCALNPQLSLKSDGCMHWFALPIAYTHAWADVCIQIQPLYDNTLCPQAIASLRNAVCMYLVCPSECIHIRAWAYRMCMQIQPSCTSAVCPPISVRNHAPQHPSQVPLHTQQCHDLDMGVKHICGVYSACMHANECEARDGWVLNSSYGRAPADS